MTESHLIWQFPCVYGSLCIHKANPTSTTGFFLWLVRNIPFSDILTLFFNFSSLLATAVLSFFRKVLLSFMLCLYHRFISKCSCHTSNWVASLQSFLSPKCWWESMHVSSGALLLINISDCSPFLMGEWHCRLLSQSLRGLELLNTSCFSLYEMLDFESADDRWLTQFKSWRYISHYVLSSMLSLLVIALASQSFLLFISLLEFCLQL